MKCSLGLEIASYYKHSQDFVRKKGTLGHGHNGVPFISGLQTQCHEETDMRHEKKYIRGLLLGLSLLVAACSESVSKTTETMPEGFYSQAQIQSDFEALYSGLKSAHVDLYAHRSKTEYDAFFKDILTELDRPLPHFDVQTIFQRFAAYGNVGHARIDFPNAIYDAYREGGGKSFPVYFAFREGRAFVSENYSGVETLKAGMEVLSINDMAIDPFLKSLEQHISADTRYMAHSLLVFTLPQYIWLEYGEIENFDLEARTPNGNTTHIVIPSRTRADIELSQENKPKSFSLSYHERVSKILGDDIAYLRPGPFYNFENTDALWNVETFSSFIDESFESYLDAGAKSLIIDLRLNPGGDNSFSDVMIAWFADEPFRFSSEFLVLSSPEAKAANQARLDSSPEAVEGVSGQYALEYERTPFGQNFDFEISLAQPRDGRRFDGEVFVLIDQNSYSNAVNVAALIQDYDMGTIMGEKTSDMATTYGAMETFTLPETGISVGFPKAQIIRPSGDRKVDGVTPDIQINSPILPTQKDVILERALTIIRN